MIILTGGAGFIGSAFLRRLNDRGVNDAIVVDSLVDADDKILNLRGKRFSQYIDKEHFLPMLSPHRSSVSIDPTSVDAIVHLGACTSTTERNLDYLARNNVEYSRTLAEWAFANNIPFIYASSAATYGDGALGFSDDNARAHSYKPLNPYGESKHQFDLWLIDEGLDTKGTGFKFFNVFGPNEYHKEDMASLVFKAYNQILRDGKLRLFKSYDPRYKDGEFVRDFIYVKDCLDVLEWSLDNPNATGIFNLGTGIARSWNDLAAALFAGMQVPGKIEYIDMPESIRDAYQYYTQAEMGKLRSAGYTAPFTTLEDSVADYVRNHLMQANPYY